MSLGTVSTAGSIAWTYNKFLAGGTYEKYPLFAIIHEASTDYGVLGTVKHLTTGLGMANYAVSALSQSCAFGLSTVNSVKLILPWSGSAPTFTPTILQSGSNWSLDI